MTTMPDPTLHGNGDPCPACGLRREADRQRTTLGSRDMPCNICGGTGRIPRTAERIVSEAVAEARALLAVSQLRMNARHPAGCPPGPE